MSDLTGFDANSSETCQVIQQRITSRSLGAEGLPGFLAIHFKRMDIQTGSVDEENVSLELSGAQAIVLFEFLWRFKSEEKLNAKLQAAGKPILKN